MINQYVPINLKIYNIKSKMNLCVFCFSFHYEVKSAFDCHFSTDMGVIFLHRSRWIFCMHACIYARGRNFYPIDTLCGTQVGLVKSSKMRYGVPMGP